MCLESLSLFPTCVLQKCWTPLMFAVQGQNMDLIVLLLEKGSNVNAKAKVGIALKSTDRYPCRLHFTGSQKLECIEIAWNSY